MIIGDIVTILTPAGEIVGELGSVPTDDRVKILNPRLLIQNPESEGQVGFAKGVAISGEYYPKEIVLKNYFFITPSSQEFVDAHSRAFEEQ